MGVASHRSFPGGINKTSRVVQEDLPAELLQFHYRWVSILVGCALTRFRTLRGLNFISGPVVVFQLIASWWAHLSFFLLEYDCCFSMLFFYPFQVTWISSFVPSPHGSMWAVAGKTRNSVSVLQALYLDANDWCSAECLALQIYGEEGRLLRTAVSWIGNPP